MASLLKGISRLILALAIVSVVLAPVSCRSTKKDKNEMPQRDINAVLEAHTPALMQIQGVTGTAIGALEDSTPCILVLVLEESAEIDKKVPQTLEGYPVRLMVSGKIVPMKGE